MAWVTRRGARRAAAALACRPLQAHAKRARGVHGMPHATWTTTIRVAADTSRPPLSNVKLKWPRRLAASLMSSRDVDRLMGAEGGALSAVSEAARYRNSCNRVADPPWPIPRIPEQ